LTESTTFRLTVCFSAFQFVRDEFTPAERARQSRTLPRDDPYVSLTDLWSMWQRNPGSFINHDKYPPSSSSSSSSPPPPIITTSSSIIISLHQSSSIITIHHQ
ncbi:hypothetical protein FBUS_09730, partial [Fasciolopsis buskii]